MPTHLTDIAVQNLREGVYFDDRISGFALRVGKLRKTWFVVQGNDRTRTNIGHYPHVSLAAARKKAHALLGTSAEAHIAPPFQEALEEFLNLPRWKPRSRYEITRSLNRH